MAGPDLTIAREQVRNLMDDAVKITIDPHGATDATLDQVSGRLVQPGQPFERTLVHEGPCIIRPMPAVARQEQQAGGQYTSALYIVSVEWDADGLAVGQDIECTASLRDPSLVERHFTIRDVPHQTYLVVRQLVAELRE